MKRQKNVKHSNHKVLLTLIFARQVLFVHENIPLGIYKVSNNTKSLINKFPRCIQSEWYEFHMKCFTLHGVQCKKQHRPRHSLIHNTHELSQQLHKKNLNISYLQGLHSSLRQHSVCINCSGLWLDLQQELSVLITWS